MIDTKKINRVKGILSARQGAEIPKYTTGGPFNANDPGFKQWYTHFSINPNPNTWAQYQHAKKSVSNGSIDQIIAFTQTNGANLPLENPTTAIPGDPKITPTTAVETSALANEAVDAQKQQIATEQAAAQQYNKVQPVALQTPEGLVIKSPEEHLKETLKNTSLAEIDIDDGNEKRKKQVTDAVGYATTAAIQGIGNVVGAKQAATDSNLTKGVDAVYGTVAEGIKNAGSTGQVIGTAMQMGKIAGDIIQELGGGTDQQTAVDKWMDSPLFSWWLGAVNGFAGKNTQDFGVDQSIMSQVGSSYGDSVNAISEAANKAGKKYGLFSAKDRKKADAVINSVRSQQNAMGNIADTAATQRLAVQSMGEQAGLTYSMMTDGGYSQKYTYSAKHGGSLEWNPVIELDWEHTVKWEPQIELNWELPAFKEGGNIDINEELEWIPETKKEEQYPKEYLQFKASLPDNQKNTPESEYNTYLGWKLYGKPKDFKTAKKLGMYTWDNSDNSWHGNTVAWDKTTGIGHFLKPKHHSTIGYELDWFNKGIVTEKGGNQREMTRKERKEWEDFKSNYILIDEGDFYKYVPKNKKGGSLGDSDIPEIEETNQKNVIPEGALHKNKHHMEHAEGLTKKGIPVIDDDGDQQAEIEHSEIIFTLEVTKKLEEYYEIFYSDETTNKEKEQAALDAGKLLVYQILENTEDRTGLIESCKKGGSLILKKSTDDLIEEVLEWMPTIVIIEEKEENKSKKDTKEKSEKEKMKEAIKEVLIDLLIS